MLLQLKLNQEIFIANGCNLMHNFPFLNQLELTVEEVHPNWRFYPS